MGEIINFLSNIFSNKKEKRKNEIEEAPLPLDGDDTEDKDIFIPEKKLSLKESYDLFMGKKDFFGATQKAELMLEQGIEGAKELLKKSLYAEYKQQLSSDNKNDFLISQKEKKLKEILEAEYGVKYADELIKKIREKINANQQMRNL